ncbi:MAG: iron-containing alcohol dehydrogenase [Firmicutes bacterium]|nr:iron-containing alcohol dehydrogenase [Bacillota bacterium]
MVIESFVFANTPKVVFGAGTFGKLDDIISQYGEKVLIVTGGSSLRATGQYEELCDRLRKRSMQVFDVAVKGEPSPALIDEAVERHRHKQIDAVLAIGGGSVLDAGKAISAMLLQDDSVMAYLEGVGKGKKHTGTKVPFIAVPTTSGTGSEATKNAVLSQIGEKGFKKSLRHDRFVPDIAVLDPMLTISCPPDVTAASGLDAFTQLLGAYVSVQASPMTDAVALSGLHYIKECLIPVCTTEADNVNARAGMAYASLMSGIALANAGLGIVHGLASPVGGYFDIPHGVVCGTLVGEAVKMNIGLLRQEGVGENPYLKKYAKVGAMVAGTDENDVERCCEQLIAAVEEWIKVLKIPRLGKYGISKHDLDKIAEAAGNKNNPVQLEKEQIMQLLLNRL